MYKRIEFDPYFPQTGEATIQLAAFPNRRGGMSIEKRAFAQSESPLYGVLDTIRPEVGVTYLLVNALSAWEYYDDNKNGDGFNERPYRVGVRASCGHPDCTKTLDGWIAEHELVTKHYHTFEEHGGIYVHHKNQDKSKSRGKVVKSIWNPKMHRNELLLRYVNDRGVEIVDRVASGDFPAVSMGTHVKWDVCTICGHRAATRAQYCDHARNHLRKILGDGRKVSVLNPSPRFFDISMVIKPADPTGWTLMKVAEDLAYAVSSAELGEQWQQAQRVSETFHKVAEEIGSAWANPTSFIGHFARQARSAGVDPLPAQGTVYRFAAEKLGLDLSEQHIDRLVLATPALTAILGTYPEEIQKVASEIHHVMRQQAYAPSDDFPDFGIGPGAAYRAAEPPRTDMLTVTDPYTGHVYQTTRGTAMDASRADVKDRLLRTGLFGGLYAAGLHLGLKGGLGLWSVPAGLALGASTDRFLRRSSPPYRNPLYQTDQGIPVSGGTEFKQASAWAAKLAEDLHERSSDGRIESILRRTSFSFQKWASLPVSEQVDYLLSDEGSAPLNASTLADNLYRLLTS